MYQASVPALLRGLNSLKQLLQKGAAHAEARKFDGGVLVAGRLFPDMFPLSRQVQIASDTAKGAIARLAGADVPSWADDETTLAQLVARIDKTIAFIEGFKPEQIDGSEQKSVTLKLRTGDRHFKGQDYLLGFVLPNFYFHITTTYSILRHNGVELGKLDYLGQG